LTLTLYAQVGSNAGYAYAQYYNCIYINLHIKTEILNNFSFFIYLYSSYIVL